MEAGDTFTAHCPEMDDVHGQNYVTVRRHVLKSTLGPGQAEGWIVRNTADGVERFMPDFLLEKVTAKPGA